MQWILFPIKLSQISLQTIQENYSAPEWLFEHCLIKRNCTRKYHCHLFWLLQISYFEDDVVAAKEARQQQPGPHGG